MNISAILTEGADMHPREAVQHLTHAVLQASGGQLQDDATALCLDWHGGRPRDRDASSGANREVRAVRLAKPGSIWAHRFYPEDGRQMRRSEARAATRDERWSQRRERFYDLIVRRTSARSETPKPEPASAGRPR